jgi:hypothetical protein
MNKNMWEIFKKVAKKAALAAALLGPTAAVGTVTLAGHPRPLKEGEEKIAHSLFGDEIDTKSIRLHSADINFFGKTGITLFNHVWVFRYAASTDYSKEEIPDTFVHEMAHVWQYQHGRVNPRTFCRTYDYTLTPQSRLNDFCIEQEASIIADYSTRFLFPGNASYLREDDTKDALLQKVVEARLPQAQAARATRENKSAGHAVLSSPGS